MLYILVYFLNGTEFHLFYTSQQTFLCTHLFFLISSLPALKKGWYHPIIFQHRSLVMSAACSHKANQRVLPSSRNLHDSQAEGSSRPPSCTVRKVCSWCSSLTTPPAPTALKFFVSCKAGGQPCSWEEGWPAPQHLCRLCVTLVLHENQAFSLGF